MIYREAGQHDAQALLDFVREHFAPLNIHASEFRVQTVNEEIAAIMRFHLSDNSLFFLAEEDGEIVATCTLTGMGWVTGEHREAYEHIAVLGLTVKESRRSEGIGAKLLELTLAHAKEHTKIRRVEVSNYADNPAARQFFLFNGFALEGIKRKGVKKNGVLQDVYLLARML